MGRQSVENKAFGEGARRQPMDRRRFLDQKWWKLLIHGGPKVVKKPMREEEFCIWAG